jgi:hypothetical protein
MPELNFNALIPQGPRSVAEGFNIGQEQRNQLMQQQQARQLNEIQLRNALRGEQEAQAESEAVKGATSLAELPGRYRQAGLGKQALAAEAALAKQQTDKLTQAKTQVELVKHAANQIFANPQNAAQILTSFNQRTGIDVSDDLAQLQQLGGDPDAIKNWAAGHVIEADKLLPKFQEFSTPGGGKQIGTVNPLTGGFTTTKTMAPQLTPGEQLAHQDRVAKLSQETASGNWSPDSVEFAAQTYAQTGQMPPVGMGTKAMRVRDQILQRASEIARGVNVPAAPGAEPQAPVDMATAASNVTAAKQTKAAQAATVRDFSAGPSSRRVTANNTAINHLDTMSKLATDLGNSDIRVANAAATAFAKATGSPAPANFDAARQLVAAEVIKAVVANGGGVKEREEAANQFSRANSPAQLKGVVNTYKELLAGQLDTLGQQYESGTGRKDFESKLTPATKKVFDTVRGKTEAPAAPVKISSDADYNKLPSGAVFIAPDGSQRRKP